MKQTMSGVDADQLVSFSETTHTVGVEPEPERDLPTVLRLLPNAPNPFTTDTTIRFDLPEAGEVELNVYDSAGRRVRSLISDVRGEGEHRVRWDGRSDRGQAMPSGIYFYRFRAGQYIESRRMTLLR